MASQKGLSVYVSYLMKTMQTKVHEIDRWEHALADLQRTRSTLAHLSQNIGSGVIGSTELLAYYENYHFQLRRIAQLEKEELVISRRIEKCREEIISLRQSLKQVQRLMARRQARKIDRQNRLQAEGFLALGLSRKLMIREASLFRVPFGVTSIRISRGTARKIGQHSSH
ncbi:hypothetical protein [Sulfobacillus thermosulfidooxidans]|uniref:hypothetical protein n=1 Tax=Sulfobacillus thermosulfidooxidans TaxID=28034 RepID=UPI0009F8B886|nr:hypothetical protein [Sulfobacillus thermosulfidooxidans]